MRVKVLQLRVPRRDAEFVADLLRCHDLPCEIEDALPGDPRYNGPRTINVFIPEGELMDAEDEMCDVCFGWNDNHEEGCVNAIIKAEMQSSGSLPESN